MELKIRTFLKEAGYELDESTSSNIHLLRFFEQEFGLEMMAMLEQEWVNEQLDKDLKDGFFSEVRKYIGEDHLDSYDDSVKRLLRKRGGS